MRDLFKKLHYCIFIRQSKWNLMVVVIPLILLLIWGYLRKKEVNVEGGSYTIGYVDRIYWPIISHKKINYSYVVNDIKYDGTDIYDDRCKTATKKLYLVQFSTIDNNASHIFQNIPVPDSIKTAPPNGWKELPEWAKTSK